MFLQGYGPLILSGTWQTVKLAVLSLILSFILGLLGAGAKLSRNRVTNGIGTLYTTLIRGVPDLVLMLLLFYSIQIWLNQLTDLMSWD
ncbi:ABC transporter permease subunit, partial [Burkholderia gladioli]